MILCDACVARAPDLCVLHEPPDVRQLGDALAAAVEQADWRWHQPPMVVFSGPLYDEWHRAVDAARAWRAARAGP